MLPLALKYVKYLEFLSEWPEFISDEVASAGPNR
jgi:hypothetical protein